MVKYLNFEVAGAKQRSIRKTATCTQSVAVFSYKTGYNALIMSSHFTISTTLKKQPPALRWQEIKNKILGQDYRLSLVFIGRKKATSLNRTYRNKNYAPNVLSFPLDDVSGEIYICPEVGRQEAADYGLSPSGYLQYLFIHGCLHLKGFDHGDTMNKQEKRYLRLFNIT